MKLVQVQELDKRWNPAVKIQGINHYIFILSEEFYTTGESTNYNRLNDAIENRPELTRRHEWVCCQSENSIEILDVE